MSLREQLLNFSSTAPSKRVFPKIQRKFQNPDKDKNDEDEDEEKDDEMDAVTEPIHRSKMRTLTAEPDYDESKFGKGVVVNVSRYKNNDQSIKKEDEDDEEDDDEEEDEEAEEEEEDDDDDDEEEDEENIKDDYEEDDEEEDSLLTLFKSDAAESSKRSKENARDVIAGELAQQALSIRELILETRILQQQPLTLSQRLPRGENVLETLCHEDSKISNKNEEAKESLMELLDDLIELRFELVANVPEITSLVELRKQEIQDWQTKTTSNGQTRVDKPISWWEQPYPQKDEDSIDSNDYWRVISEGSSSLRHWRDSTLDSWNRRLIISSNPQSSLKKVEKTAGNAGVDISEQVRLALGGVDNTTSSPILQQNVLKSSNKRDRSAILSGPRPSDNDTLLKLTRRVRSKAGSIRVFGEISLENGSTDNNTELDEETFQDGEFYATLLKEYVDSAGENGTNEGEGSNLSTSNSVGGVINYKAGYAHTSRAGVDRRASKGRKIKYVIQPKLTHFCAPSPFIVPPEMSLDIDKLVESLFKSS
jgi:protein AATF/BFR2